MQHTQQLIDQATAITEGPATAELPLSQYTGMNTLSDGRLVRETVIDSDILPIVAVNMRTYMDGSRLVRFEHATHGIISRKDAERRIDDALAEALTIATPPAPVEFEDYPVCEDGGREVEFETWDRLRRERFGCFNESYDHIEVVHGEQATAVYYGSSGGRVVAQWNSGTGSCSMSTIEKFADDMARDVRNYIINASQG